MNNNKIYGVINRLKDNDATQTLGHLLLYKDQDLIFECKTLELPDNDNKNKVSRIPEGVYKCVYRWSQKYSDHYILLDVKNRSYILIHAGNYKTQIEGCILVGNRFSDINKDGSLDVLSSKETLSKLISKLSSGLIKREFILVINDIDNKLENFNK